jgi:hypothetical protein
MGLFGSVGKFVGRQHGHMFGAAWVRGGADITARQWHRVRYRPCPKCGMGHLIPDVASHNGVTKQFVGCNRCDHYEATGRGKDPETIQRLRDLATSRFEDPAEREARVRYYRLQSRAMFVIALVCLALSGWLLLRNPGYPVYVNAALIGLFVISRALRASYRCWQVQTGRIFEPGLFKVWFNSGKWFV